MVTNTLSGAKKKKKSDLKSPYHGGSFILVRLPLICQILFLLGNRLYFKRNDRFGASDCVERWVITFIGHRLVG